MGPLSHSDTDSVRRRVRLSKQIPITEDQEDFILPLGPSCVSLACDSAVLRVRFSAWLPWAVPCHSNGQDLPRGSLLPAGIFIYPLEESEVVASFEAAVGSRRVTFQLQNRHRAQDCCLQCSPSPGRLRRCAGGECRGMGGAVWCSWQGGAELAVGKSGGIQGAESPYQATPDLGVLWGWRSQCLLSPPSTSSGALSSFAQPSCHLWEQLGPVMTSSTTPHASLTFPHPSSLSCPGHLVLDEDVERSTFIIVTGILCPSESLAVTLNTVQELPTLPDGALRLLLPSILTPHVPADPESEPASLCDDRLALW